MAGSGARGQQRQRSVVIVATLDTRGDEVVFLREIIEARGHDVLSVDVGVMGQPFVRGDYTREAVAEAGGVPLQQLVDAANAGADRKQATDVMTAGARKIVQELAAAGRLDGIMSLGGSTAAAIGTSAMKGLPLGLPKLLVTTFLGLAPVGDEDITVMQSPVDLVGLNRIVGKTLANAAGALVGMIEQEVPDRARRPLVGVTALGVTTPAVQKVISRLDRDGYDAIVFHAQTAKLDELTKAGVIDAIIDVTSFETVPKTLYPLEILAMLSGSAQSSRDRLESAIARGIPQIIAPGGLDMHIIPGTGIDAIPPEYRGRAWSMHGPNIVLVRTSREDLDQVGRAIAERANRATAPVKIIIPLRGYSDASREGAPLYDPDADRAFVRALKRHLDPRVPVIELDCHINDDAFGNAIIASFREITTKTEAK
ncbi:MAG: Tm-1-like ATP-binding domain-containing protein [Candidatus Binatia bacterium]|jgi:uncharacterized protein (UPF0261 family)